MKKNLSRRNFIQTSAATAAATIGTIGVIHGAGEFFVPQPGKRLPREVCLASISQMGMSTESSESMVGTILQKLSELNAFKPDIVCLPEVFATSNVNKRYSLDEKLRLSSTAISRMAEYSRTNSCYIICPVYTESNGKVYNSAVVLNRKGENTGAYHKIHLTEGEISMGLTPGPISPPVFKTDVGTIGVQICFDLLWDDGWKALKHKGAEIVFFPSAFPGGQMVNAKAWENKYVVVSSTRKHTSKICDISGAELEKTGIWRPNILCSTVNLEKAFLHLWPYVRRFPEIHKKYGPKVGITIFHEEEWAIIESLSPEIKVKEILSEFEIRTHEEHVRDAAAVQENARQQL